ncbi:MAG: nitrate reductase, partial [Sulfurovum sp.]
MQTVCSYCGVGCKFEIKNEKLKGMKNYPTNLGLSCAKGASQLQSIDTNNRLKKAMYREKINTPFIDSDYEQCIDMIVQKIKNTPPKKIGFYLS